MGSLKRTATELNTEMQHYMINYRTAPSVSCKLTELEKPLPYFSCVSRVLLILKFVRIRIQISPNLGLTKFETCVMYAISIYSKISYFADLTHTIYFLE